MSKILILSDNESHYYAEFIFILQGTQPENIYIVSLLHM